MDPSGMQANNQPDKKYVDIHRGYHHHPGMDAIPMPTPAAIEDAARARRISIASVCRRADIDPTAFQKWKAGKGSPNLSTIQKMIDAIEAVPLPAGEVTR